MLKISGFSLVLIAGIIFILGSGSVLSNSPPIFGVRTDEGFVPLKVGELNLSIQENRGLAILPEQSSIAFDQVYAAEYLDVYGNFSDINYKKVVDTTSERMLAGAKEDNIKGFEINGERFAVHLLYCDSYNENCVLRVNGVPTGKISVKGTPGRKDSFALAPEYDLKIGSAQFNFCDNRRFCNVAYEAYDRVDVVVDRR